MPLVTEGASIAAGGFAGVSLIYLTRAVIVRRANRLTAPGIHITARPTAPPTIRDAQSQEFQITVRIIGDAAKYHVRLHLLGAEGIPDPPPVPVMRCDSPPLTQTFVVDAEQAKRAWCVVSWINAQQDGMRVRAICIDLFGTRMYEWRWVAGVAARYWWQQKRGRFKPLGVWVRHEQELRPLQGPFDNLPAEAAPAWWQRF